MDQHQQNGRGMWKMTEARDGDICMRERGVKELRGQKDVILVREESKGQKSLVFPRYFYKM